MNALDELLYPLKEQPSSLSEALDFQWPISLLAVVQCQLDTCFESSRVVASDRDFLELGRQVAQELSDLSHVAHTNSAILERMQIAQQSLATWMSKAHDMGLPVRGGDEGRAEAASILCDTRVFCEWLWDVEFFRRDRSLDEKKGMLLESPIGEAMAARGPA